MSAASSPTPTGRETALVALGQVAVMVLGGVLALLVAQLFGKNTETDAFFAAYGFYALGISFTQTLRLTAVSRLVQSGAGIVTQLLGAVVLIAAALAVPMVVLAGPLGRVLVETDPTAVAPAALQILWVALTGQLLASMLATVLTVRGSFKAIGVATLLVGLVSIATFLLVERALGIEAAAVGLSAGGAWLVGMLGGELLRAGWRPQAPDLEALRAMAAEAGRLTFASATFLGATVAYVICLALAARQGAGEATLFAYGYVLVGMLLGATTNVLAMVRSPALLASSDRTAEAAANGLWSFRFTLVLAGPVLAMALLVGKPVIGFALGSGFSDTDIGSILVTLVCLVGWLAGSAAGIFAVVELLARGALVRLALLAAVQVAALPGAALAGAELAGIQGIAVALSAVTLSATVVQLRWAFGGAWRNSAVTMARAGGRELAVLAVAFAPSAALVLLVGQTRIATTAAALLAAALVAVATYIAWPHESRALLGLVR